MALLFSAAVASASDAPAGNPFETVREGSYMRAPYTSAATRILNWNIDRGKHMDGILAMIRASRPDVMLFQEVDLGARRTGGKDIAQELAKVLGTNYAFAPEFRELSQGVDGAAAYHGQAIITTLKIRSSRILRFEHQSGFWKPQPLLISKLPILQRREGGRIALVSELEHNGGLLAIYNLHLESRGSEQGRLLQLGEVLADAARYPASTPVIVAGDFNTKSRHSPLIARLRESGYRSCFGERRIRTHILIGALDWIFVRGPIECEDAQVHRDAHASDHYPITARLRSGN